MAVAMGCVALTHPAIFIQESTLPSSHVGETRGTLGCRCSSLITTTCLAPPTFSTTVYYYYFKFLTKGKHCAVPSSPQSFPCPECPELALGCDSQAAEVPGPQGWVDDRSSPGLSKPAQLAGASVGAAQGERHQSGSSWQRCLTQRMDGSKP